MDRRSPVRHRASIIGCGIHVVVFPLALILFFPSLVQGESPNPYRELRRLSRELVTLRDDLRSLKKSKVSEDEYQAASDKLVADEERILRSCIQLSDENPATKTEIAALYWAAGEWPHTEDGKRALQILVEVSATANLDHLGQTFESIHATHEESMRPLVPVLLQREKENPDHPYAAKLLTESCLFLVPGEDVVVAEQFKRIADIIVERHAASSKLANFCELLGGGDWSPPWALPFESHLRRILEVNQDRFVRCSAQIALASIVQESGESRQVEAAELFEEYLAEFDGTVEYHGKNIENTYRAAAEREIAVIQSHGFGKQAPETVGMDLKGNQISLTDYRGKVLLVSFWATWCRPCMRLIPLEKDLLERFGEEEFAIVGVNADSDVEVALKAVEKHQIPWASFRNQNDGQPPLSKQWSIPGFPTFYLLDGAGIVRKRWLGEPPLSDLTENVERLQDTNKAE